jgi:cell division protein FtsZ
MADNIVATAVKGVAEIITLHGNVNIDFTDVYTVMHNSKVFIMGTGLATGEGRAMKAVNDALESPLLDSNDIYGTKNILLNIISGKEEITIGEIGEIIQTLQERAGQEADIIWGNGYDENLGDQVSVTILATGFKTNPNQLLQPREEPEKFNLGESETTLSDELEKEQELEPEKILMEAHYENLKNQNNEVPADSKKEKVRREKTSFSRIKKDKKKKNRKKETVNQGSIDNWFYKNFGLSRLFDDEDQSIEG